jgi:hypothetical protein
VSWRGDPALFLTNLDGEILFNAGHLDFWGEWSTVSQGSSTPGAPITAVVVTNQENRERITLFVANPDGEILTTTWPS